MLHLRWRTLTPFPGCNQFPFSPTPSHHKSSFVPGVWGHLPHPQLPKGGRSQLGLGAVGSSRGVLKSWKVFAVFRELRMGSCTLSTAESRKQQRCCVSSFELLWPGRAASWSPNQQKSVTLSLKSQKNSKEEP